MMAGMTLWMELTLQVQNNKTCLQNFAIAVASFRRRRYADADHRVTTCLLQTTKHSAVVAVAIAVAKDALELGPAHFATVVQIQRI